MPIGGPKTEAPYFEGLDVAKCADLEEATMLKNKYYFEQKTLVPVILSKIILYVHYDSKFRAL